MDSPTTPIHWLLKGALLCALPLFVACSGMSAPSAPRAGVSTAPPPVRAEIIVTRENSTLPPNCSPREVAQLLIDFFDAFNRGDQARLAQLVHPKFNRYGAGGTSANPKGSMFYKWDDLKTHFAERHKQGERLRLHWIEVGGSEDRSIGIHGRIGQIAFGYTRHARDLLGGPDHSGVGKGAINCKEQKFFVLMLGGSGPMADEQAMITSSGHCPAPPAGSPPQAVIACARVEAHSTAPGATSATISVQPTATPARRPVLAPPAPTVVVAPSLPSVAAAEAEAASYPQAPPPRVTTFNLRHDFPGSAERTCVEVGEDAADQGIRSGEFVAGNLGSFTKHWGTAAETGKVWWKPLHTLDISESGLTVRATLLDDPAITRVYHNDGIGYGSGRFYPSLISLPRHGRWMLVATSGPDWGCFIVTLRPKVTVQP